MKKILSIMVAFMCTIGRGALDDSVLYWLVDEDTTPAFDTAQIRFGIENDGSTLTGDNTVLASNYFIGFDWSDEFIGDGRPAVPPEKVAANLTEVMAALGVSDVTQLSFVVELFNENEEMTHYSNLYSISALEAYIGTYSEFNKDYRYIVPLVISQFNQVPEPSGGVLLLIGGGLLALRRKRKETGV